MAKKKGGVAELEIGHKGKTGETTAEPLKGKASGEQAAIPTADRIVDAAVLRTRSVRVQVEFKLLGKAAGLVVARIDEHEQAAARASMAGQQTLLFESTDKATLASEVELLARMEAAVRAAHEHWDPAAEEE